MTRDEILEYFKDINHAYNDCTRYDTLKRMLDELQEPCADAISRQAALNEIYNTDGISNIYFRLADKIIALPPIKPTEKAGHWISNAEDDLKISEYTCSNCKGLSDEDSDFCPKCGSYNGGVK